MDDFRRLLPFVRPHAVRFCRSLLLLVIAGLAEVCTVGLAIPLFDVVLNPASGGAAESNEKLALLMRVLSSIPGNIVVEIAVALAILTLVKGVCIYYSNLGMAHIGQRVVLDLRNRLFDHVLTQSMGFFSLRSTGHLMSRMNSDVEQVQEAVSTSVAELFRESVLLAALIVWIFYIDWRLASLALLIAPVALLVTLSMGRRIRRASLRSREGVASLNDFLQQAISGMRVVKAFGMERHELDRFGQSGESLFRTNMRAARILFLNSPLMEMLGVLCFIPLLFYAHARIVGGSLTLGLFGGSLFSLFRMYDPIRKLSRLHVQFQRAFASASRISELLDTHIEIHDRPGAIPMDGVRQGIEFQNVHFDYQGDGGDSRVLEGINLIVKPRMVTALVGSSGAGKSTMVSLLPRFHDVSGGQITVDGVDIRDYTQVSLRKHIAIVTQDTFLFNDTIWNNIAYGDREASEEQILQAAKAAFAHDFIMGLPMRYQTVIGERGQRLSGGERQRISIARALLKDSPILILDEATSALDSESEKVVQQALANLMRNRTTFVIAHRLSTIRNADLIVVLDRGRIVEAGNHESLLRMDGLYRRFFRLQTDEA